MVSRLLSRDGRDEFARLDADLRAERMRLVERMTVGERLALGLALSRAACAVRDGFAGATRPGEPRT